MLISIDIFMRYQGITAIKAHYTLSLKDQELYII